MSLCLKKVDAFFYTPTIIYANSSDVIPLGSSLQLYRDAIISP